MNLLKFGEALQITLMVIPSQDLQSEFWFLKYIKEYLASIVSNSKSKHDSLLKLELKPYGGNYRVLDKYIDEFDLDTNHFLGQG